MHIGEIIYLLLQIFNVCVCGCDEASAFTPPEGEMVTQMSMLEAEVGVSIRHDCLFRLVFSSRDEGIFRVRVAENAIIRVTTSKNLGSFASSIS